MRQPPEAHSLRWHWPWSALPPASQPSLFLQSFQLIAFKSYQCPPAFTTTVFATLSSPVPPCYFSLTDPSSPPCSRHWLCRRSLFPGCLWILASSQHGSAIPAVLFVSLLSIATGDFLSLVRALGMNTSLRKMAFSPFYQHYEDLSIDHARQSLLLEVLRANSTLTTAILAEHLSTYWVFQRCRSLAPLFREMVLMRPNLSSPLASRLERETFGGLSSSTCLPSIVPERLLLLCAQQPQDAQWLVGSLPPSGSLWSISFNVLSCSPRINLLSNMWVEFYSMICSRRVLKSYHEVRHLESLALNAQCFIRDAQVFSILDRQLEDYLVPTFEWSSRECSKLAPSSIRSKNSDLSKIPEWVYPFGTNGFR